MVHVSSAEAMEQIRWARERGLKIYAETCLQYLFLTEEDFRRPEWEGAKFICSPPTRPGAGWRCERVFDIVSSDQVGQPHFAQVAPGVPGIEVRLPLADPYDNVPAVCEAELTTFPSRSWEILGDLTPSTLEESQPKAAELRHFFGIWTAVLPLDDPPTSSLI